MHLILTPEIITHLSRALKRAGRREIGGLLMGEHIGDEVFRIVEISVQHSGGNVACFIRHPAEHQAQLQSFFEKTGYDYTRFNYLGEWHSHPSFDPLPSKADLATMQSLVRDPAVGANFLVLLIPKLVGRKKLELSATGFRAGARPFSVSFCAEPGRQPVHSNNRLLQWAHRLFSR
jgi:integrative and conjugative element protein (TIGR02256 family)